MKIDNINQLRELYGFPGERAQKKQLDRLDIHATQFISKSPFLVVSTINNSGKMDTSPRGGSPGFVHILDEQHIVIPDSKGNNRLDSLANIVETGRIATLFVIPGVDETLRLNGSARISTDAELLDLFADLSKPPRSVIVVTIEEIFLHCAKAFMRSKLWFDESKVDRSDLPSMGQMLKDQIGTDGVPETQEAMVKRYQQDLE